MIEDHYHNHQDDDHLRMIGGVKLAVVAWVMPVLIIVISCDWCQQQLCTQTPATTVQQEGESQEESQKLF